VERYLITQYMGALLYEKPASYIKWYWSRAERFLLSAPLRYIYAGCGASGRW